MDKEIEYLFKRVFNISETINLKDMDREIYDKWLLFKLEMDNFCDKIVLDCMKRNNCI